MSDTPRPLTPARLAEIRDLVETHGPECLSLDTVQSLLRAAEPATGAGSATLDELERLDREATQAPWCLHPNGTSAWHGKEYDPSGILSDHEMVLRAPPLTDALRMVDLDLVVALRNAAPYLIASARALASLTAERDALAERCEALRIRHIRVVGRETKACRLCLNLWTPGDLERHSIGCLAAPLAGGGK